MGKLKLSLVKHPQDEQIKAISAAHQQRDRWTRGGGEEKVRGDRRGREGRREEKRKRGEESTS